MKPKTTRDTIGLAKVTGVIKTGPLGLIEIQTGSGRIFANSNGLFSSKGEKITTSKAKVIVGLSEMN